ncbi:MAG: DUF4386 family protein [Syntrophaceae bacterium]|nr:DUF4386 family protein [Syntrophaceae bacterium]
MNDAVENASARRLLVLGAIAPLLALSFYLAETLVIVAAPAPYPVALGDWLSLFQTNRILALIYLNAPDILSIPLLGLMFLALRRAVGENHRTAATIASASAFLGIAVFVSIRSALLAIMSLSDRYAAAATDGAQRAVETAGLAIDALGNPTPQTAGFFFIAIAAAVFSVIMLRRGGFLRITGLVGLAAAVATIADDVSLVVAPGVSGVLMGVAGACWVVWWIFTSVALFRLARQRTAADFAAGITPKEDA